MIIDMSSYLEMPYKICVGWIVQHVEVTNDVLRLIVLSDVATMIRKRCEIHQTLNLNS